MTTKMTTTMTKTTTKTTTKTLAALALAAAAFTAMVGPSEAAPRLEKQAATSLLQNHSGTNSVTIFHHLPISSLFPSHGPIKCFTCVLPRPPYHDPGYGWGHGPHWPYHGWGYGNRWGYGYYNWYRWHPAYYSGAPVVEPPVATYAAPQASTGNCNCLTKKMLPNGAELLQDICTQQSAIAQPQALSAR